MSFYIKDMSIEDKAFDSYKVESEETNLIENLSKINIFVGTNNSGKSRMLRALFIQKSITFLPAKIGIDDVIEGLEILKEQITDVYNSKNIKGYGGLDLESISKVSLPNYMVSSVDYLKDVNELKKKINNFQGNQTISQSGMYTNIAFNHEEFQSSLKEIAKEYQEKIDMLGTDSNIKFKKIYIPTLRGLRGFETNENYYLSRTQKDYFSGDSDVEIFTGLDLYEEVKKLLLGNLSQREKISDFQKFIGESFFDGEKVALIPNIDSDVLYVKIGTEKEYPIYNLGDGIQSLIILTFPLFKYSGENLLLFMEEPELYLHPGMQRKFLEIISNDKFNNYQYFLTTHSNHFLDMTLDMDKISIYSFNKELDSEDTQERNAQFSIENVSNENTSILKLLGVRNSAVFLSNCTIWVEGITDRYYIRHFLKLYQEHQEGLKKYREDVHYSFIEYSGNNITHWSFLDDQETGEETFKSIDESKVCSTLFLITDKDGKQKQGRQQRLQDVLGERYYCLECREIENIISLDVLKNVIAKYENELPEDVGYNSDFSMEDYADVPIGSFIESVLINKKRRGSYSSASGTISNKVDFCKKAINEMKSYDDLSEEAKVLVEKLYKFIDSNNF